MGIFGFWGRTSGCPPGRIPGVFRCVPRCALACVRVALLGCVSGAFRCVSGVLRARVPGVHSGALRVYFGLRPWYIPGPVPGTFRVALSGYVAGGVRGVSGPLRGAFRAALGRASGLRSAFLPIYSKVAVNQLSFFRKVASGWAASFRGFSPSRSQLTRSKRKRSCPFSFKRVRGTATS